MNTTASPAALDSLSIHADYGGPRFLDDEFNARADDLTDWWLDLGRVDLPVASR